MTGSLDKLAKINSERWAVDNGENTLRYDYPLDQNSIVIDAGGFKGAFALNMFARYFPHLYVFEPVKEYYNHLKTAFAPTEKVHIFDKGLSDHDGMEYIAVKEEASSFKLEGTVELCPVIDVAGFLVRFPNVNLLKLNIEGSEYEVLFRMIETDTAKLCQDIQVQFHAFMPNAEAMREDIAHHLEKTHMLTFNYPFAWENWRRR